MRVTSTQLAKLFLIAWGSTQINDSSLLGSPFGSLTAGYRKELVNEILAQQGDEMLTELIESGSRDTRKARHIDLE